MLNIQSNFGLNSLNRFNFGSQVKLNNKYSNLLPLQKDCVSFKGSKKDYEVDDEALEYIEDFGIEQNSLEFYKVIELMNTKGLSVEAACDIVSVLKQDDKKIERCTSLVQNLQNQDLSYKVALMVRADIEDEDIEKIAAIAKEEDDSQRIFENIWYSSDAKKDVKQILTLKDMIEHYDLDVTLSELSQYALQEQQKIIDMMIENDLSFYQVCDYFDAIKSKKPTNANDIFPKELSSAQLQKKYEGKINWSQILYDMYNQIRRIGQYSVNYQENNFSGSYGDLCRILEENNGIETKHRGVWTKRQAQGSKIKSVTDRISLNVKGNSDLIKKLDELMVEEGDVFAYKTYSNLAQWGDREDPITIYFKDEITDEMFNKIANITKPYARGNINGAENSSTPWMMKEKYSKGVIIDDLLDRAQKLNNDLYQCILQQCNDKHELSAGMYRACLKIMDEYERFLQI